MMSTSLLRSLPRPPRARVYAQLQVLTAGDIASVR